MLVFGTDRLRAVLDWSFSMSWAKAAAVLRKDWLTAVRTRSGFLFNVISPAAQLASFYYLSRAIGPQFRPEGMSYVMFLVIGMGFYTFLISGIHAFLQTIQDSQRTGTLEVLMSTATATPVLLMLSALSAFAGGLVQFILYVAGGMLIFGNNVNINVSGAMAVLVLSILVSVAVGMCAAAMQISIQKGSAVIWLLGACAWLMAGTMFPVSALPRPLRVLSILLPFTHSLTGMRLAMMQESWSAVLAKEIAVLALISLILLPFAIAFFSWTVRRARQFGSLSFY